MSPHVVVGTLQSCNNRATKPKWKKLFAERQSEFAKLDSAKEDIITTMINNILWKTVNQFS